MKQRKIKRSRFAQNRIAYVVYGNPEASRDLLENYGYEAPGNERDLVQAIKLLVQKRGHKVIKDLVGIHPDKNIILKLHQEKEDSYCGICSNYAYNSKDNYCGACGHSNYTGDLDVSDYISQLVAMDTSELEGVYQDLKQESNRKPDDTTLSEELHLVWNEIRKRKLTEDGDEKKDGKKESPGSYDGLLILGAALVVGILIGSSIRKEHPHA